MPDHAHRLKRLKYRAWHRGTREADYMIGGFFDAHAGHWGEPETAWFERLIEEQDVDIIAWGMGTAPAPDWLQGPMLEAFKRLDYIRAAG